MRNPEEDGGWRMEWVWRSETGGDYVRAVVWGRGKRGRGSTDETPILNLECVEMLDVPFSLPLSLCVWLVSWILFHGF